MSQSPLDRVIGETRIVYPEDIQDFKSQSPLDRVIGETTMKTLKEKLKLNIVSIPFRSGHR